MENERRIKLIEIYKRCSDDEISQMIMENKENFEEGAYDLIRIEARKRRIDSKPAKPDHGKVGGKINFDEMSTEDFMGVLVNIHSLDELNYHLAAAEAIRRNIDESDIRAYKKIVQCEQCPDTSGSIEIEMIENPQPLIILKTIDEAGLYTDILDEEGIPFEIQIIVDDKDYKRAEMATNNIMFAPENE